MNTGESDYESTDWKPSDWDEEEEDPKPKYGDPYCYDNPGTGFLKYDFDGADSLEVLVEGFELAALAYRALHADGWILTQPVEDGRIHVHWPYEDSDAPVYDQAV